MNYLYFSPFATDCINASVLLENAFEVAELEKDATIYFIYFDYPNVEICDFNNECSKIRSIEISFDNKLLLRKYRHKNIIPIPFSRIKKDEINFSPRFRSLKEVKEIQYKGINIGFGVVSNFVSFTRNINPKMDDVVNLFLFKYLKSCAIVVETLNYFILNNSIAHIKTHNGRFAILKPSIELAKKYGIEYTITEMLPFDTPSDIKYFEYRNAMPHSIKLRTEIITSLSNHDDNVSIYKEFYERRAKGVKVGDKVYTKLQNPNELPKNWDINKKNYVYFTSSEDEFFSIGEDWDKLRIFPDQETAAESIAEICLKDPSIHIYIRIHPNLIGLNYKYAKFDKLKKYSNVTVIPAESSISTYKLLWACDKCLTMGSTVGIEATYWGKVSLLLNASLYYYLDVAFIPQNQAQLEKMLLDHTLLPKPKEGCYKYAKSIMYKGFGKSPRYVNYNMTPIYFKGKRLDVSKSMTIFGSSILYKFSVLMFRLLYILDKKRYMNNVYPHLLIEEKS